MCDGEMKIHPKERGEEIGAQCILKRPPAAYQPIAAYQGAGPGEPDSALTVVIKCYASHFAPMSSRTQQ